MFYVLIYVHFGILMFLSIGTDFTLRTRSQVASRGTAILVTLCWFKHVRYILLFIFLYLLKYDLQSLYVIIRNTVKLSMMKHEKIFTFCFHFIKSMTWIDALLSEAIITRKTMMSVSWRKESHGRFVYLPWLLWSIMN